MRPVGVKPLRCGGKINGTEIQVTAPKLNLEFVNLPWNICLLSKTEAKAQRSRSGTYIICLHIDDYVNQQNNLLLVGAKCRTVIAARRHIQRHHMSRN